MGEVDLVGRVELVGRDVVQIPARCHVLRQNFLYFVGKGALSAGPAAQDVVENLAGGLIFVLWEQNLVAALAQIVRGSACCCLQ